MPYIFTYMAKPLRRLHVWVFLFPRVLHIERHDVYLLTRRPCRGSSRIYTLITRIAGGKLLAELLRKDLKSGRLKRREKAFYIFSSRIGVKQTFF